MENTFSWLFVPITDSYGIGISVKIQFHNYLIHYFKSGGMDIKIENSITDIEATRKGKIILYLIYRRYKL